MLDDLAVFDAENIDNGYAAVGGAIGHMDVHCHEMIIGNNANDSRSMVGVLRKIGDEEINKWLAPRGNGRAFLVELDQRLGCRLHAFR